MYQAPPEVSQSGVRYSPAILFIVYLPIGDYRFIAADGGGSGLDVGIWSFIVRGFYTFAAYTKWSRLLEV